MRCSNYRSGDLYIILAVEFVVKQKYMSDKDFPSLDQNVDWLMYMIVGKYNIYSW